MSWEPEKKPPYSLGVYLDVLTQVTDLPILVLPDSHDQARFEKDLRSAYASRIVALLKELKETVEEAVTEDSESEGREESKDTMLARVESRYRGLRRDVLAAALLWERDVLMLCTGVDPGLLHYSDCLEDLRVRAAETTAADVLKTIAAIQHIDVQLERNMSETVVFQNAFLH